MASARAGRSRCAASPRASAASPVLTDVDFEVRAGRGPRAGRRERRRQVDPPEDPAGRATRPDAGRDRGRRRARTDLTRSRRPRRAGIGMVFQEFSLVPDPDRRAEHLPRRRAAGGGGLIDDRQAASASRARSSPRWASTSIRAPQVGEPGHRVLAADRDRQGAGAGRPRPDHGRADGQPRAAETEALFELDRPAEGARASRSSTSRTGWTRSTGSPTASRSCATASGCSPSRWPTSRPAADRRGHRRQQIEGRAGVPGRATHRRRSGRRCSKRADLAGAGPACATCPSRCTPARSSASPG